MLFFLIFLISYVDSQNFVGYPRVNKVPEVVLIERISPRAAWEQPNSNVNKMGLAYCQIPKNAATIMKILLCDLYRYFKRIPFKIQVGKDKSLSECELSQWYKNLINTTEAWSPNVNETKMAISRHPVKRFLSLYGYLCEQARLCGTPTSITKFTKDVYNLLKTNSTVGTGFSEKDREIVVYHSQPQTWFCNILAEVKNFHFIHHGSDRMAMKNELETVFDMARVPRNYSEPVLNHILYSDTVHANQDKRHTKAVAWLLENNPQTMAYFNAIYYDDFALLGYQK